MLHVAWVSFAPVERTSKGYTSAVASVRYRITSTAAALAKSGAQCKVTYLGPGTNRRTLLERFRGVDAVVLGKIFPPVEAFNRDLALALELIAQLRAQNIAVLADYSDDHFANPVLGEGYRALANAVDRVTATTPALAEAIRAHTSVPVNVITDLVEGARGAPRASRKTPLSLLWFGHPVNLETLRHGLPQVTAARVPYSLTVLSAPDAERYAGEIAAKFRPWSTGVLFAELNACDAVILPSNPHDPHKAVKSPNRFAETIWAGRFGIAHPLPAWDALGEGGWVGEDLGAGLKWYAENPDAALSRIRRGQELIAERHSPAAVAKSWQAAIEQSCNLA